jgi:hypothetical protein
MASSSSCSDAESFVSESQNAESIVSSSCSDTESVVSESQNAESIVSSSCSDAESVVSESQNAESVVSLSDSENMLLYNSIEEVILYLDSRFGVKGYTYHTKRGKARGKAKYYYATFACPRSGETRRTMVCL